MKTTLLAAALFTFTAIPVLSQQPPEAAPSAQSPSSAQQPATQPTTSAPSQQASPEQSQSTATAAAETQPVELRSVSGEFVNKLDTKTAKPGDAVVIQTSSSVKTEDGTEIPKGSKLTGKVLAVQPSTDGKTSQVALNIDHAEIKGGQTMPIHSEIQSIGSDNSSSASGADTMSRSAQAPAPSAAPSSSASGAAGGMNGTGSASSSPSSAPGYAPGYTPGTTPNSSSGPAAGTIVARNGHIAIRTTSVPGVLLANNAPGEQDPRMTQASGILLGAKKDVELSSGTKVVLGVAAMPNATTQTAAPTGGSAAQ